VLCDLNFIAPDVDAFYWYFSLFSFFLHYCQQHYYHRLPIHWAVWLLRQPFAVVLSRVCGLLCYVIGGK